MTNGVLVSPTASQISPISLPEGRETDRQIQSQVQQLLLSFQHRPLGADRRSDRREAFPYPVYITPFAEDHSSVKNETIVALGKHLSAHGLDFYSQAALPYRRATASWECSSGQWLAMLMDLKWCRSNRHGWYENGGRFLRVVDSPMTHWANTTGDDENRWPSAG